MKESFFLVWLCGRALVFEFLLQRGSCIGLYMPHALTIVKAPTVYRVNFVSVK